MKLTVLMDNNTYIDRYYKGEPAVPIIWRTETEIYFSIRHIAERLWIMQRRWE